ncbi:hypothetical protein HK099_006686, partial [Clydaea vesicula]
MNVVVYFTKALLQDQLCRFSKISRNRPSFQVKEYNPQVDLSNFPNLLLVSADQFRIPGLISLLLNLKNINILGRVFVDEAHLLVSWSSFRRDIPLLI